jgi:hypothetical protein
MRTARLRGMVFIGQPQPETPTTEAPSNVRPTGAPEKSAPSFIFLRILLVLMALGAWGAGIQILPEATSGIHEILAYLCFLTGAVFFSAAAVLEGLRVIAKRIG